MVGQNIGKYRVLDRVGRGGMGTVYRAMDETLHREVAIKVLNAELNDPEIAKRFRAEAITVARLSHPGIATIYELFQNDGQWLMVMEFVRGETLDHMVERLGPLPAERAAELCMQTLAALAHAHSMGVVHRDLKPANIMITETGAIKIMDFGIARVAGTEHLTNVGFMMGTPAYMAPEQVIGQEIDARADLYAMGVVFFRLTTAKLPFKGETPFAMAQSQVNDPPTPIATFRTDLPPWVEPVVVRALAKGVNDRFQSAVEFHEALGRCLSGLPMASLYNSSAPSDVLMTPARAMPTGSLQGSVVAARLPAQTPAAQSSAPGSTAYEAASEMTALATPIAMMQPHAGATLEAAEIPERVESTQAPANVRKSPIGLIALAVVLIGALAGGGFWLKSRHAASGIEAPPPPAAADSAPAPGDGAAGPSASETASVPTAAETVPTPPPAGTTTTETQAPAAPAAASTPMSPAASASRGSRASAVAPAAPVEDAHQAFTDVKLLLVSGKKGSDEDVLLNFAGGQLTVFAKRGGTAITTLPYKSVLHATYVHARDPKWDASLFSPPEGLDVGGTFRTSKHWLVLQSADAFLILRLEDANVRLILQTLESRTGLSVERPR